MVFIAIHGEADLAGITMESFILLTNAADTALFTMKDTHRYFLLAILIEGTNRAVILAKVFLAADTGLRLRLLGAAS